MTMRTEKAEAIYAQAKAEGSLRPLYDERLVKDFKYWRIVENRFPHDKIAEVNHLLVLKRECQDLSFIRLYEWHELFLVLWEIRKDYDNFVYNLPAMSSIKNIPHAHLYRLKKEYK